jgi:hypothetical protein
MAETACFFMPESPEVVSRVHTYKRSAMAERGRKGGLARGEHARQHKPAGVVVLSHAELASLAGAYDLIRKITERAGTTKPHMTPTDLDAA